MQTGLVSGGLGGKLNRRLVETEKVYRAFLGIVTSSGLSSWSMRYAFTKQQEIIISLFSWQHFQCNTCSLWCFWPHTAPSYAEFCRDSLPVHGSLLISLVKITQKPTKKYCPLFHIAKDGKSDKIDPPKQLFWEVGSWWCNPYKRILGGGAKTLHVVRTYSEE